MVVASGEFVTLLRSNLHGRCVVTALSDSLTSPVAYDLMLEGDGFGIFSLWLCRGYIQLIGVCVTDFWKQTADSRHNIQA